MTTQVPYQLLDKAHIAVFRAGLISNTSIPTGLASPQWFAGFSKEFDPTNSFNGTTGRFQPTVPGYYQINALVRFTSDGINATFIAAVIGKNGANYHLASVSSNGYPSINVSDVVYLNGATDYVQVGTMHNAAGAATNVSASISGALVRPA